MNIFLSYLSALVNSDLIVCNSNIEVRRKSFRCFSFSFSSLITWANLCYILLRVVSRSSCPICNMKQKNEKRRTTALNLETHIHTFIYTCAHERVRRIEIRGHPPFNADSASHFLSPSRFFLYSCVSYSISFMYTIIV